ncbi:hypothetical protein ABZW30_12905 [Kitasatospora sp. NPDC004669]|uniref:hypothetical protein n=1 Tax=Kitasatospora sp. NPDC004669 TaxID=3154555 RepID=UPI0033BB97F8
MALLLAEPFSQVIAHPRFGALVSDPQEESAWVVTLPDELRDALADAPSWQLAGLAVPWSGAKEFHGYGDPAHLTAFLEQLAALARRARSNRHSLYSAIFL